MDLWIEYTVDEKGCANNLGTFKTLSADDEAMHIMAALLADFIIEESGEKSKWGYSCGTMEAALKRKDELLMKYNQAIVRNNAARKEKIYENGG